MVKPELIEWISKSDRAVTCRIVDEHFYVIRNEPVEPSLRPETLIAVTLIRPSGVTNRHERTDEGAEFDWVDPSDPDVDAIGRITVKLDPEVAERFLIGAQVRVSLEVVEHNEEVKP